MTAEICRITEHGDEVKSRDLLPGQTMKGLGAFSSIQTPVLVEVTALEEGKGIEVRRVGDHKQVDMSVVDHYEPGRMYVLSKGLHNSTVFHLHPH